MSLIKRVLLVLAIVEVFVRSSVRLSHCGIVSKQRKLESRNLRLGLPPRTLVFCAKLRARVRGFPSNENVNRGTPT